MNNIYMNKKEIQQEERNILKKIIEFLDKNKIKYSIFYGTLLGAVRHTGFIPWDDDIDLVIPRNDYNKLIKILKNNNFSICEDHNICGIGFELSNSDWPFIKIVNKDIVIEDEFFCDKNLWVDIFPLDGVPPKNKKLYYFIINRMRDIHYIKRKVKNKVVIRSVKDKIKSFLYLPINYKFIINRFIKYASKYSDSSKVLCNHVWATSYNDTITNKEFKLVDMKFDELSVKGIENPEKWLAKRYGSDFMKLPPIEKRITHSFNARRIKNEK